MSTVLMYSGGFDSVAARVIWKPDKLVYCMTDSRYQGAEMARLPNDCEITDLRELHRYERPDAIIPLRNLFFIAIGAQYGDTIGLAATHGNSMNDKTETFAELSTALLSYLWAPQPGWTLGKVVTVHLPVKAFTKRELVKACERRNELNILAQSFSCYTPVTTGGRWEACGECNPCARKWAAFASEGHGDRVTDASAYVEKRILPDVLAGQSKRPFEDLMFMEAMGR